MFSRRNLTVIVLIVSVFAFALGAMARTQPHQSAEVRKALMDSDRAFFKATSERGIDGWMSFMADDAVRIAPIGGKAITGRTAVRELDAPLFADPKSRLVWEPADGGAFADGKHGFTTGRAKIVTRDKTGTEETAWTGAYVTIWRQTADGSWKVILDTGAADATKTKPGTE